MYSGLQMLVAKLTRRPIRITTDHSAFHSVTDWTPWILPMAFPVQVAALLLVLVVFVHRSRAELLRAIAAILTGFIAFNKIFSPQYLIWLIPFIAAMEGSTGKAARGLFAVCCALTPATSFANRHLGQTDLLVILGLNLRNALMLALFVWLTCVQVSHGDCEGQPIESSPPVYPQLA